MSLKIILMINSFEENDKQGEQGQDRGFRARIFKQAGSCRHQEFKKK